MIPQSISKSLSIQKQFYDAGIFPDKILGSRMKNISKISRRIVGNHSIVKNSLSKNTSEMEDFSNRNPVFPKIRRSSLIFNISSTEISLERKYNSKQQNLPKSVKQSITQKSPEYTISIRGKHFLLFIVPTSADRKSRKLWHRHRSGNPIL